ncbi:hypothetical protein DY000_02029356 [Brassica cretica]|uniref:Uncharacterized protein n=1 Tax=Brassica cretica TaxID=69181 RepID=A0ABQ7DK91_BRACR|nr:hypothetical protein DY000_02029356 [Brassica cretica]
MIEIKYPFARIHLVDKRVLIGLEKLACNKKVAHAICYVFLRMIGVGVSIGVLGVACKNLGSKREWKVLFERVERPTTPAPDETKPARPLAPGFGTSSEPTPRRQLMRVGATKKERRLQSARKKKKSGATIGSEVHNPRAKRRNEADIWSDVPQRGEAPALEAERPGGAT